MVSVSEQHDKCILQTSSPPTFSDLQASFPIYARETPKRLVHSLTRVLNGATSWLQTKLLFVSFLPFSKIIQIQIQIHQLFTLLGILYTNSINLFSHSTSLWLLYFGLVPQVPIHLFSLTECTLRTRALLSLP